jgi:protoporphyrinogen/coproporphyrinogen III oxidase
MGTSHSFTYFTGCVQSVCTGKLVNEWDVPIYSEAVDNQPHWQHALTSPATIIRAEGERFAVLQGIIIGGGISGLALAHFLGLHERPVGWELWEASGRLGGTIGTDRSDGFSVDWGPNGFLDREPLTLRLVSEIGLDAELEPADRKSEKRFIAKKGQLHPVPFSPPLILKTGLLSLGEKLRIFAEPFIPALPDDRDESVFDFAARRIGRGAAETFVDPMVSGVFGGVASQLSLPACFPIMRELELKHGGLVKGMIARMRQKRKEHANSGTARPRSGGPAGPGGWLTSFKGGLDVLVDRLHKRLEPIIRTGHDVVRLSRAAEGWEVRIASGRAATARTIVLACPAFAAAEMLVDFDRALAQAFSDIPYAPIAVVASGHRREDIEHPLDGFGFLIPRNQHLRTLGSIWTSSIFTARAPGECVQFRSMLGGAGDPEIMSGSDDGLWNTIRNELSPLIGIRKDPVFLKVFRWKRGIPQFTLGHRERRARIESLAGTHPGLYMVGNAYYGVGLNDCIKMAHRVAGAIREKAAPADH